MQKTVVLVLSVLILLVFTTSAPAKTEIIDVVHLKNGNVIQGVVIEMVANETIKIETADGRIFVYKMNEVEKMTTIKKLNKTPNQPIILKNRVLSTVLSLTSYFGISGLGQLYNGEYLKASLFCVGGLVTVMSYVNAPKHQENTFVIIHLGQMGYCVYDANVSAKKINEKRLQQYEQSNTSTSLQYVPHEGLMASYSYRF